MSLFAAFVFKWPAHRTWRGATWNPFDAAMPALLAFKTDLNPTTLSFVKARRRAHAKLGAASIPFLLHQPENDCALIQRMPCACRHP